MSRRSPTNDRYKKDANVGSTRRSAASAKPTRPQAGPSGSATPSKSAKASKPARPQRQLLPNPDTAEFRRWNYVNYGLLVAALAFAFATLVWGRQLQGTPWYYVMWAGWGACLAGSLYIQLVKLRKLRQEWIDSGQAAGKAKADAKAAAEKAKAKAEADKKSD